MYLLTTKLSSNNLDDRTGVTSKPRKKVNRYKQITFKNYYKT